jgi:hypothetical protein
MSEPRWLSRRNVLRGAGVALALPWLESLAPRHARAQVAPSRHSFIAMYFPCGVAELWKPKTTGSGDAWALSPILEPLAPVKPYVNVLANVGNYGPFGGHVEPSHSNLSGAMLTCVKPMATNGSNAVGGVSVDQVIARSMAGRTKLDSLQVGLSTLDSYTDGLPGPFSRSISWRSPTEPLYKLVSPQAVFDHIVAAGGMPVVPAPRSAANKSVLDFVMGHATTVKGQLGRSDAARVDQFLTSVRELERNIQSAGSSGCTVGPRPTETYDVNNVPADYNRGVHADLMVDLVVMALECDVTHVVSFMLDDSRSSFNYDFLTERHFTSTTSTLGTASIDGSPVGLVNTSPTNDHYATLNRWFIEKLARLCQKLAAIPDGTGNLLDNAIVWCGSEMHGVNNDGLDLPIVTVGKGGGTLRTNQSLDFAKTPRQTERLANLYLTFLRNGFLLPEPAFGTAPNNTTAIGTSGPVPAYALGAGTAIIPEILA